MNLLGSGLVYAGLSIALAGVASVVKPLRFLRVRTRSRGALVFFLGLAVTTAGLLLPAGDTRIDAARSRIDEYTPVYQFGEMHRTQVAASREQIDAALRQVTPEEIRVYPALTWLRRLGRPSGPGILNPPPGKPILDIFRHDFVVLSDEPGRELLMGAGKVLKGKVDLSLAGYHALDGPPAMRLVFNFRIDECGTGGCTLTTETRVITVTPAVRRAFAGYWRVIYPGSALIRRSWLVAIKRRAERAAQGPS